MKCIVGAGCDTAMSRLTPAGPLWRKPLTSWGAARSAHPIPPVQGAAEIPNTCNLPALTCFGSVTLATVLPGVSGTL
jgi:hypothetical protein